MEYSLEVPAVNTLTCVGNVNIYMAFRLSPNSNPDFSFAFHRVNSIPTDVFNNPLK
jgi:hypothetical protein